MNTSRLLFIIFFCCASVRAETAPDLGGKTLYIISHSNIMTDRRMVLRLSADGKLNTLVDISIDSASRKSSYLMPSSGTYAYLSSVGSTSTVQIQIGSSSPETWEFDFTSAEGGNIVQKENGPFFSGKFTLISSTTSPVRDLRNLSMRVIAKKGSPAILGFAVGGTRIREFILRAVGPGLSAFGIRSVASDPRYNLGSPAFDLPGEAGMDWSQSLSSATTIQQESERCGAFPLRSGSKDKADIMVLAPGAHTIVLEANAPQSEGDTLLEVYEVPE